MSQCDGLHCQEGALREEGEISAEKTSSQIFLLMSSLAQEKMARAQRNGHSFLRLIGPCTLELSESWDLDRCLDWTWAAPAAVVP